MTQDAGQTMNWEEKRKHKRIQRKFVAHFHVRPHDPAAKTKWDIVTVRNLSAGGVLFNYDKELTEGRIVDFKINFPGCKDPIVCVAKIIRIEAPVDYGILPTAVFFAEISEKDKKAIDRLASKLDLGEPTETVLDRVWDEE